MIVYPDICCLKRPFDDQTKPRIAVETTAVLGLLQEIADGHLQAVRSSLHDLENSHNPDTRRAAAVAAWLDQLNAIGPTPSDVIRRGNEIRTALGLGAFDALHLAWAENLQASHFVTVDDRIIIKSKRQAHIINVKVVGPMEMLRELGL